MVVPAYIEPDSYVATAGQTIFPYKAKIYDEADIDVYQNDILLTIGEYSVTNVGNNSGGDVILASGATLNDSIVITRSEPLNQDIEYVEGDEFPAAAHEEGLDRSAMRDQYLNLLVNRCLKLPASYAGSGIDVDNPDAGKILVWNTNGDLVNGALSDVDVLNRIGALVPPTVNDDSSAGYSVGSIWVDINLGDTYFCIDSSVGSAVWSEVVATDGSGEILNIITPDSIKFSNNFRGFLDSNGNEHILFSEVASAVNYSEFRNSSAGNAIEWVAAGSDTNIGLVIRTKGGGSLDIEATSITLNGLSTDVVYGSIYAETNTYNNSAATNLAYGATAPSASVGKEICNFTYTPKRSDTVLRFSGVAQVEASGQRVVYIVEDGVTDALRAYPSNDGAGNNEPTPISFEIPSTGTTARTFRLYAACASGVVAVNGDLTSQKYNGTTYSNLGLEEIKRG